MTSTQRIRLLMWLAHHRREGITQLEATTHLGILRLSERIRELQAAGYSIVKQTVKVPNRYGDQCRVMRYWLEAK